MIKRVAAGRKARPRRTTKVARDGETERRILDAAHTVFLRRGTAGARMQEIAREAGVNSALLHYYFRSKDRLAQAVFHRAAAQLLPAVAGVLASERPLPEKVRATVEIELDRLSSTPYLPGYIISELAHHPERITHFISALTGSQDRKSTRLNSSHSQISYAVFCLKKKKKKKKKQNTKKKIIL